MIAAVLVAGALAQMLAWWYVASGRGSVWTVVGPVIAVAGAVAVAVEPPSLSGRVGVIAATAVGVVGGAALYGATFAFVRLIGRRWRRFVGDAEAIYRNRDDRAGSTALTAAAAVAVGEELFWRGAAQRYLGDLLEAAALGAGVTLAAYVLVNSPSRNLAIVAGAVVGGAVWGGLAWWTAGVLASVLAHVTWTTLMLARPVVGRAQ